MVSAARRHADFDFDALSFLGVNGQVAAQTARTGTHPDHTHAALCGASGRQAAPVVANGKAHLAALRIERDHCVASAGMARHIGQGFLRQPEQVRLGFIGQASGNGGLEFRLNAGTVREAFS